MQGWVEATSPSGGRRPSFRFRLTMLEWWSQAASNSSESLSGVVRRTGAPGANPDCPTVMCLVPCPQGQYLALNDQGCETCDCYDPCEVTPRTPLPRFVVDLLWICRNVADLLSTCWCQLLSDVADLLYAFDLLRTCCEYLVYTTIRQIALSTVRQIVFGKIGRIASEDVLIELLKTKCMPVLLYMDLKFAICVKEIYTHSIS